LIVIISPKHTKKRLFPKKDNVAIVTTATTECAFVFENVIGRTKSID
jgi:hypothetical protein